MSNLIQFGAEILRSAVPIRGRAGHVIGTGAVVGTGLVLTALHVVDPEPRAALRVADLPTAAILSLPLRRFGPARQLARWSCDRARDLCGSDLRTVDLALLAVPGLTDEPLELRRSPVERDDYVVVAGYPAGVWGVTAGPVTSRDNADFVAHVVLGDGGSGAPALDRDGRLAGIATMDHGSAGAICIGPELLGTFLERITPLLSHMIPRR